MAITIQELLASDTISQVVDKINFNFDQLLLNGGGAPGPNGPAGPPGPIGGRGERGTEWYEGTDDPNVTPPTATPLTADYYLQSNGDVWEYTGLTWTNTGINLKGPAGPTGASVGWSYFGNNPYPTYAATFQNVLYPAQISSGITLNNQGVPTTLIGAVGPNDASSNPGIPFTPAFKLNTTMAGSIDSSVVSMVVHQKNSSTSAIKFMGGGDIAADNYEQSTISNLSSIDLGSDDSLNINVPKTVTGTPGSLQDTYGFNVYTINKGQSFRAGRSISFTTGTLGNTLSGPLDVSDFSIQLNTVNSSDLPTFSVDVLGSQDASFNVGNVTIPLGTTKNGRISLDASSIGLVAQQQIILRSGGNFWQLPNLNTTSVTAAGLVSVDSSGRLGSLNSGGSMPTGILGWNGSTLTGDQGTDNRIVRWDGTNGIEASPWSIENLGALVPSAASQKYVGTASNGIQRIYFDEGAGTGIGRIFLEGLSGGTSTGKILIKAEDGDGARGAVTITNRGVFIGEGLNSSNVMQYSGSTIRINGRGSGTTEEPGGLEFQAGGSGQSDPPRIMGPAGIYNSYPSVRDSLEIKGGVGGPLASGSSPYGLGRNLLLTGGDASNNSNGGAVYISGGEGTGLGTAGSGFIYIGYHPYRTNKHTSRIQVGDQGAQEAFMTIKQPNDNVLNVEAEAYTFAVQSNHSSVQSDARTGGVKFLNSNDTKAIEFHTQVGTNDYTPLATQEDNLIFSRGSAASGGTNGFVIGVKDKDVGIRLNADDTKLELYASGNNEASDYNDQAFTWYAEGNIHIDHTSSIGGPTSSTVGNPLRTRGIFASGEYGPNNASTGSGTISGQWIRVGRNVTFSGIAQCSGSAGQRLWPLPLTTGGTTVLYGSGTLFTGTGGTYGSRMMPVEALITGGALGFKWGSGVWVGNPYASTPSNSSPVRFTVQYMLA